MSPLGPKKVKNDPKNKLKSNFTIEENIENKGCSTTWVDPKTVFEPYSDSKNRPLELQKVKNDPKIRIGWSIENESCSTKWVDPKTTVEL